MKAAADHLPDVVALGALVWPASVPLGRPTLLEITADLRDALLGQQLGLISGFQSTSVQTC